MCIHTYKSPRALITSSHFSAAFQKPWTFCAQLDATPKKRVFSYDGHDFFKVPVFGSVQPTQVPAHGTVGAWHLVGVVVDETAQGTQPKLIKGLAERFGVPAYKDLSSCPAGAAAALTERQRARRARPCRASPSAGGDGRHATPALAEPPCPPCGASGCPVLQSTVTGCPST